MIENYLNKNTYQWTKHAEFEMLGTRYVVVSEYTTSGFLQEPYMLFEKGSSIFNMQGDKIFTDSENEKISIYAHNPENGEVMGLENIRRYFAIKTMVDACQSREDFRIYEDIAFYSDSELKKPLRSDIKAQLYNVWYGIVEESE